MAKVYSKQLASYIPIVKVERFAGLNSHGFAVFKSAVKVFP